MKANGARFKAGDSTGTELAAKDLLVRTLALKNYLSRAVLGDDEQNVGIFLPPTVPAVATNLAVALAGRVAVNLNYTVTSKVLQQCCEVAELKHVITSRKFIEKVGLDPGVPMIYLEDVKEQITLGDKLSALCNAKLRSAEGLHRYLGLDSKTHEDTLTIIFTSGSTGVPKGVVLSGGNILANVDGIDRAIHLDENDIVLGVLPLFHSFGYTVTLWAAMSLPCAATFHFSPLEARPIGKLAEKHKATVLLATPTFLRSYMRRIEPEQFQHLSVVVVGAEKMPMTLFDEFEQRFGCRPIEGYGATELSPVVSVNIPPSRATSGQPAVREGSVGKPFDGLEARVVSVDDDTPLPTGEAGLLEIRGPSVMQGYWKQPELTAAVMHDDWYRTGDMAKIDEDGFIHITGRMSRFSKIGGEMVPHIQIEEQLALQLAPEQAQLADDDEESALQVAVTAVPDAKRGERLIVLYTPQDASPEELIKGLVAAGLPNLYLPTPESFLRVDEIPVLGTGKLDLAGIRKTAEQHFLKEPAGQ
ncbi:MAG: hypothetical protein Aurels2KO_12240 [Aureliella sp.]